MWGNNDQMGMTNAIIFAQTTQRSLNFLKEMEAQIMQWTYTFSDNVMEITIAFNFWPYPH